MRCRSLTLGRITSLVVTREPLQILVFDPRHPVFVLVLVTLFDPLHVAFPSLLVFGQSIESEECDKSMFVLSLRTLYERGLLLLVAHGVPLVRALCCSLLRLLRSVLQCVRHVDASLSGSEMKDFVDGRGNTSVRVDGE